MHNSVLPMEILSDLIGGYIMNHLELELFALALLVIALQYRVVRVDFNINPIHKNAKKITLWLAGVLLGVIVSSWLK